MPDHDSSHSPGDEHMIPDDDVHEPMIPVDDIPSTSYTGVEQIPLTQEIKDIIVSNFFNLMTLN